jgi:hypothetical protein
VAQAAKATAGAGAANQGGLRAAAADGRARHGGLAGSRAGRTWLSPTEAVVDVQHGGTLLPIRLLLPAWAWRLSPRRLAIRLSLHGLVVSGMGGERAAASCSAGARPHRTSGGLVLPRGGRRARSRRRRGSMAAGRRAHAVFVIFLACIHRSLPSHAHTPARVRSPPGDVLRAQRWAWGRLIHNQSMSPPSLLTSPGLRPPRQNLHAPVPGLALRHSLACPVSASALLVTGLSASPSDPFPSRPRPLSLVQQEQQ